MSINKEDINYKNEYYKQQIILLALKSENRFLKENLLKFEKLSAMRDNIFFRVILFFSRCVSNLLWFFYRVFRKIKNIILRLFRKIRRNKNE